MHTYASLLISLASELKSLKEYLPDAPTLHEPIGVSGRVVDPSIEPGGRRFNRGLVERKE
jgi:hypothetical protein